MATLYVIDQGARLHKEGNRIVIKKGSQVIQWVHSFKIEQVVLFGNVSVTPHALSHFLREGVDVVLLGATGKYKGRLVGPETRNVILRRVQFQKYDDENFRLSFVRSVVSAKIGNMRSLLMRSARRRDIDLSPVVGKLRFLKGDTTSTNSVDSLRGIEGTATSAYFSAYRELLDPEFRFEKRTRRPPKDPANALLSFGYTLLGNSIQSAVNVVGLDPYLGFFHVVDYGRPSLALDLMEEFRPVIVDALILNLVNHHVLSLDDFEDVKDGVYLNAEGRGKFIPAYQKRVSEQVSYAISGGQTQVVSYRRCFELQARKLVKFLKGEIGGYEPFLIR